MKKGIIFIALISIPFFSFCQEQFPVFSEDNYWEIRHSDIFGPPFFMTIKISGDSIINEQSYKMIWWEDESTLLGFGFDENKKTYFRPIGWEQTEDIVIYDFNLDIGDTFDLPVILSSSPFWEIYFEESIVEGIDSVTLNDGSFRKRYHFSVDNIFDTCHGNGEWTFIDGIGSNIHPAYVLFYCFEFGIELDCYSNQSQELHGNCLYSPTFEVPINPIKVFPNPTDNKLIIKAPGNEILSLLLLDINGHQVLLEKNGDHMNLGELPGGVYFLKVQMRSGSVFTERIVKY